MGLNCPSPFNSLRLRVGGNASNQFFWLHTLPPRARALAAETCLLLFRHVFL